MKPEIQELLTRAKGTLDEARLLAEAGYHSGVVSRSYYAMFYSALAMAHFGLRFTTMFKCIRVCWPSPMSTAIYARTSS